MSFIIIREVKKTFIKTLTIIFYKKKQKQEVLIVFETIIADILSNKKLKRMVTELFLCGKKLNETIILCCSKKYPIKLYTLIYHEHSK